MSAIEKKFRAMLLRETNLTPQPPPPENLQDRFRVVRQPHEKGEAGPIHKKSKV
jgi:hypothetical protein